MRLLPVVLGAGFTAATAWALGRLLLARLRVKLYREDEHLVAFVAGSAVLSMLVFALACCKLIYPPVLIATGAIALFAAWRTGAFKQSGDRLPALPRFWRWLYLAVYVPFALVALVWALAPEISPDGSSYHLGLVSRYFREHGFIPMPWQMYAQLSQGIDLIYLFAYSLGRHSAAATYHCLLLLTLPWLIVRFGQRVDCPAAGVAAALFTFVSPVMQIDGASAYNDVGLAAVVFTLFYVLEASREKMQDGVPALTGLLAGFCYGVKYTAFVAVPYALVRLAIQLRAQKRLTPRPVLVFSACVALMTVPWMARNQIWYANPFAPLMNRLVANPTNHVSFEDGYTKYFRKYEVQSYAEVPLEITVRGTLIPEIAGPLFLLTPLALFALRLPVGRRVLLAALVFASTYPLNIGTRFLIPALPFISLALALAMPPWRIALPLLVLFHGVLSWHKVIPMYAGTHTWRIPKFAWKESVSERRAAAWLNTYSPHIRAAQLIENTTPADAVIFAFNSIGEAYTSRETRVSFQSALGDRMYDLITVATNQNAQPVRGERFVFQRQALRKVRVVQSESHWDLQWSVAEVRVKDGVNDLPRLPVWRLTAQPYPWDVPFAFDNSPLTRWRSWRKIEPGMFIEIDFSEATQVSEVDVEMSRDQWSVKMHVEGLGDDGTWRVLAGESTPYSLAPQLELRRAAADDLKRNGITHLLIRDSEYGAEDFKQNRDLWGLTEVGTTDGWHLYKLE